MTAFVLAHVGHDHGMHHWAPMVLFSFVATLLTVALVRRARQVRR